MVQAPPSPPRLFVLFVSGARRIIPWNLDRDMYPFRNTWISCFLDWCCILIHAAGLLRHFLAGFRMDNMGKLALLSGYNYMYNHCAVECVSMWVARCVPPQIRMYPPKFVVRGALFVLIQLFVLSLRPDVW